jgi:hypothetical protein
MRGAHCTTRPLAHFTGTADAITSCFNLAHVSPIAREHDLEAGTLFVICHLASSSELDFEALRIFLTPHLTMQILNLHYN